MLNKVILQANVTRDIELRYTGNGSAIAKVGLAVNDSWKDRNTGEKREDVMYIDGTVFGKAAETINQYVTKGSKLLIVGKLKLEQWQENNGQKRQKHSIAIDEYQFLDSKQNDNGSKKYDNKKSNAYVPQDEDRNIEIDDDEIPF